MHVVHSSSNYAEPCSLFRNCDKPIRIFLSIMWFTEQIAASKFDFFADFIVRIYNRTCDNTQVEQSGPDTVGCGQFRRFHGSSIPVTGFIRFHPEPGKIGSRIQLPNSCVEFLPFSGQKWGVSCRFHPDIHGILLQESSTWVADARRRKFRSVSSLITVISRLL